MPQNWYVLKIKRQSEPAVAMAVAERGFRVFYPLRRRRLVIRHIKRRQLQPLLPGYLFTAFDIDSAQWADLAHINGVLTFLGHKIDGYGGFAPSPVRKGEMEHLMQIATKITVEEARESKGVSRLIRNQRALITTGVLAKMTGIVLHDAKGRVLLELDKAFGGKAVSVPREAVRPLLPK